MMATALPEIAETEARGEVASRFALVRELLGNDFVPTIYRVLAPYPVAFDAALARLRTVVACAGPAADLLRAIAGGSAPAGTAPPIPSLEARSVIARYQAVNPMNLMVCLSSLGHGAPEWPGVMVPPGIEAVGGSLIDRISDRHGKVIVPGLWRELCASAPDAHTLWEWVDRTSAGGEMVRCRNEVRHEAQALLTASGLTELGPIDLASVPQDARRLLNWFPTGIATVIVEAQWLMQSSSTATTNRPEEIR